MSAGTFATYQGKPCVSVTFRRARGPAATLSTVVIPASAFPSGFDWREAAGELERRPARDLPDLSQAFGDSPAASSAPLAPGLDFEGVLVLAEGAGRSFVVPGLIVTSIELASRDDQGGPVLIRLTLADSRLFAGIGLLPRWRFNALHPDGSPDLSAFVAENFGEVRGYWLSEVAEVCARASWRKPELARVPELWRGKRREVTFDPFTPGLTALANLCAIEGAEEPVLHLDGSLGVYKAGEGLLGYAQDGIGPNAIPFPPEVVMEADGAGDVATEEASFPAEFVAVVGGPRVATVALANWEPVLLIEGRPFLLSEELVRYLTGGTLATNDTGEQVVDGGAYGLDWLRKWILLPDADQGTVEPVDADVLRLLAEQAWRLWRAPGVEKHARGFYTGDRGKNAQLVPLLDRAETRDGRRISPTVEAYSFEARRKQLDATSQNAALAKIQKTTAEAARALKQALIAKLQANPGSNVSGSFGRKFAGLSSAEMYGGLLPPGVDHEQVDRALQQYRELERAKQIGVQPEIVSQLERALEERAKAADGLSYEEAAEAYAVAKQLAEWERETAQAVSLDGGDFRDAFRREFGRRVENLLEELGRKRRLANRQRESDKEAGRPRGDRISFVFQLNIPRRADAGARVESAELGIVRTSSLCGHLEDEDVPSAELSRFVPRPPRVLFGATVRPRIDVPPGFPAQQPTTGGPSAAERAEFALGLLGNLTSDDFIPPALTDRASIFVRAFKRVGKGTIADVDVESVPLDRCALVRRPDWQELVPLEEQGNARELEVEASKIAIGLADTPSRVKSRALQLAGAWPVNCDGIVSAVEVVMANVDGVPCGFETRIATGGDALAPAPSNRTRTR